MNVASNNTLTHKSDASYIPNISSCYENILVDNGILFFNEPIDFINCLECLENKTFKMDSLLFTSLEHLSDSVLYDSLSTLNYSPFDVYSKFENYFSVSTKRQIFESDLNEWANEGDTTTVPNTPFVDFPILTLINQSGEYAIGDSIFILKENGEVFQISEINYNLLDSFQNNYVNESHPKIHKRFGLKEECAIFANKAGIKPSSSFILLGITSWSNIPFLARYWSISYSYKLYINNFNYLLRLWPTRYLGVEMLGECHRVTNDECTDPPVPVKGWKKQFSFPMFQITTRDYFWAQGPRRAKSNRVFGVHEHLNTPDLITSPTW